jgi:hypothetical protein
MVYQDEVESNPNSSHHVHHVENHRGESHADIAAEDWADALIIAWENEGHQIDGDDFDLPKAVLDDMKRKLNKAFDKRRKLETEYRARHRPRENHSETVATKERLIQRITAEVYRQFRVQS